MNNLNNSRVSFQLECRLRLSAPAKLALQLLATCSSYFVRIPKLKKNNDYSA
jgi:hypothetical protein